MTRFFAGGMCKTATILLIVLGLFIFWNGKAHAFDLDDFGDILSDTLSVGAAYSTHLFLHELGHQVVADEVGAEGHKMSFFTNKDGKFYPGLSQYKSIPEESKLPYAAGGERMAGYTFEFALESYRKKPTTFNKALMLFSNFDFLAYSLLANYVHPDDDYYDPNIIREETGISKGALLSIVGAKTMLNAYRIVDEEANFRPEIILDKKMVGLGLRFTF